MTTSGHDDGYVCSECEPAKAAGRLYRFGDYWFERNGWRWGFSGDGYGVGGYRTPLGAVVAWWRFKRQIGRPA